MAKSNPSSFLINFIPNLGEIFGKLYITDSEIIFDPLNKKLKGFVN